MTEAKKQIYLAYRNNLASKDINSYYDMNGNLYTSCSECDKKDCGSRVRAGGCMAGETKPEILKKVVR